eukprot:4529804-Amphidinium_carterae.1
MLSRRDKWVQMQLAFADAVEEISKLSTLDTSSCHTAYWSAVRALRCYFGWEHITQLSTARQLSASPGKT